MALGWNSYLSTEEREFRRVSDDLVRFGQLDVRNRIIRRALLSGTARTKLLQHYYDRLYKSANLQDLPDEPKFYFLATSLTSGQLCSFSKGLWIAISLAHHGPSFISRMDSLPLARVVAASSAFPPLFAPVEFHATELDRKLEDGRTRLRTTHYLTDGGIFDNLGAARMQDLIGQLGVKEFQGRTLIKDGSTPSPFDKEVQPSHVIVSDASAVFEYRDPSDFRWLSSRTIRSTDILMARLAELDMRSGGNFRPQSAVHHLSIEKDEIPPLKLVSGLEYQPQSSEIQRAVRLVRTDLDQFGIDLVRYLVRHGHEVAANCFNRIDPSALCQASRVPWDPWPENGPMDDEHGVRFLKAQISRTRKENIYGIFDVRDPISWLYAVLIALLIVLVGFILYLSVNSACRHTVHFYRALSGKTANLGLSSGNKEFDSMLFASEKVSEWPETPKSRPEKENRDEHRN